MSHIVHRKPVDPALLTTLANHVAVATIVVSILVLGIFTISASIALHRVERADQIASRV